MGSPFLNPELLRYTGTGNITGTLSTGVATDALAPGVWMIWATQDAYVQINTASGAAFGAKPAAIPMRYPVFYVNKGTTNLYLGIKRVSTSGTYYANLISGPA